MQLHEGVTTKAIDNPLISTFELRFVSLSLRRLPFLVRFVGGIFHLQPVHDFFDPLNAGNRRMCNLLEKVTCDGAIQRQHSLIELASDLA